MWVRILLVVIGLLRTTVGTITEWWLTTEIKTQLEKMRTKWRSK